MSSTRLRFMFFLSCPSVSGDPRARGRHSQAEVSSGEPRAADADAFSEGHAGDFGAPGCARLSISGAGDRSPGRNALEERRRAWNSTRSRAETECAKGICTGYVKLLRSETNSDNRSQTVDGTGAFDAGDSARWRARTFQKRSSGVTGRTFMVSRVPRSG